MMHSGNWQIDYLIARHVNYSNRKTRTCIENKLLKINVQILTQCPKFLAWKYY